MILVILFRKLWFSYCLIQCQCFVCLPEKWPWMSEHCDLCAHARALYCLGIQFSYVALLLLSVDFLVVETFKNKRTFKFKLSVTMSALFFNWYFNSQIMSMSLEVAKQVFATWHIFWQYINNWSTEHRLIWTWFEGLCLKCTFRRR